MRSIGCLGVAALLLGLTPAALASPPQADRVLAAQSSLTTGLVQHLESQAGRDIVVSPASLAAVLAVLDLGSDTAMRTAMQRALGFGPQADGAPQSDLASLRALIATLKGGVEDKSTSFSMANAIAFDPKSAPHPSALERLRTAGVQAEIDDLRDPATLKRINDWVAKETKGLIPSILDAPPSRPGLVALNALYFKGLWLEPFDKARTAPMPFQSYDGAKAKVAMMHIQTGLGWRREGRFTAVDLPYQGGRFALAVVTTTDRPARASEFASLDGWLGAAEFHRDTVNLSLPRFALSESAELLPALDDLGLKSGRTSPTALAGFSSRRLDLAAVEQRTYLRIDEQGTEAAAVTGVTAKLASVTKVVEVTIDKPFVFALRDTKTGLILLSGYVGHPSSEATASR
jgi:serpin B